MPDPLESHRWARIRLSTEDCASAPALRCLDCKTMIDWDPKTTPDPPTVEPCPTPMPRGGWTCARCGGHGHNVRTCNAPPRNGYTASDKRTDASRRVEKSIEQARAARDDRRKA